MADEFNFEDDMLFAKPVKSAVLEENEQTVYWLNGSTKEHAGLLAMVAGDKTRQEAFELAVYQLACNENGTKRYAGRVPKRVFTEQVDHTLARNYGMLILGIGKGKEKSLFETEVDEQAKNSEPASVDSKG